MSRISISLPSLYYVLVGEEERKRTEFDAKVLETTIWFVREGVKSALRGMWRDGRCTERGVRIRVFCLDR